MKNLLDFGCRCLINYYWYRVPVLHMFNFEVSFDDCWTTVPLLVHTKTWATD